MLKVALDDTARSAERVFKAALDAARANNIAITSISAKINDASRGRVHHRSPRKIIGKHLRSRRANEMICVAIEHDGEIFARPDW